MAEREVCTRCVPILVSQPERGFDLRYLSSVLVENVRWRGLSMVTTQERERAIRRLAGGTIFRATFTKRTTGEERTMVCRLRVRRNLSGRGLSFNPKTKGLLVVWDLQKQGYRMIPLDALHSLKIRGQEYKIGS